MPPSKFKYRSITANCGNDTLGKHACTQISAFLQESAPDFFVINSQEVNFGKTQAQLQEQINKFASNYEVKCLGQMTTRTKTDKETLIGNTGMATFVVYKKGLTIDVEGEPVEARRSNFPIGAAYNKGGLVTNFTVTRSVEGVGSEEGTKEERITVQAVTGHLDAGNVAKRNKDWLNLYRATVKEVKAWEDLVAACPDLMLSGYDINTRNKYDKQNGTETDMWEDPKAYPEIHALYFLTEGAANFGKKFTYDHTLKDENDKLTDLADPKRDGDAARGPLDQIAIYDGNTEQNKFQELDRGNTVHEVVPEPDSNSKRDHNVIISPSKEYTSYDSFIRVRNFMAARLYGFASDLAEEIMKKDENQETQAELLKIYNQYLGPDGLVVKAMELHIRKLECFQRVMSAPQNKGMEEGLKNILFGEYPWCNGNPDQLIAKQELMHALLDSLDECEAPEEINACIDYYFELEQNAKAADALKDSLVKSYKGLYEDFVNQHVEDLKLIEARKEILSCLDAIAHHEDDDALKKLDLEKLETLNNTVIQCFNSIALSRGDDVKKMEEPTKKLMNLSNEVMGRYSAPVWRALAKAVTLFVSILPKMLTEKIGIVQDTKLSDSIIKYNHALFKSAFREQKKPDEQEPLLGFVS